MASFPATHVLLTRQAYFILATQILLLTVRHRGMGERERERESFMGTGISEASKRVPIFSFATQGGKQASSYF